MSHPTEAVIAGWLESGVTPDIGEHVGSCDRCSGIADQLTRGSLADRVRSFLAAPSDYEERIAGRVEASLSRARALEAWAGLFTIAPRTIDLLIGAHDDEHG